MRTAFPLLATLAFLLAAPAFLGASALAGDPQDGEQAQPQEPQSGGDPAQSPDEKKDEEPKAHTDAQLKEYDVFDRFEQGYAEKDIDKRMQVLRWFGQWRHKKVLRELKKIWRKEKQLELLAVAAEGLGNQTPFAREAGKALVQGLEDRDDWASREDPEGDEEIQQKLETRVLVQGLRAIGNLGYRDGWDDIKSFIDHDNDDVAAEMMLVCGRMKEYRALPMILEWFNYYPDGYSWSGGGVKVDTGASGNKDRTAAKAKWKAKYGRRKKKARPLVWDKMVEAVEMLTGEKMSKPDELKAWMDEHERFLKKHGV